MVWAGSYVANSHLKKESNASTKRKLELNILSGGLNTVIQESNLTPRMSCIMFLNFDWSAFISHIIMIDKWSLVAFFWGLILWQWVIGWRGVLANLSKYTKGANFIFLWSAIFRAGVDGFFSPLLCPLQIKLTCKYICTYVFDVVLITVCHFWFIMVCFRGHC